MRDENTNNDESTELAIPEESTDEKLDAALAPLTREYSEISITKEMFRKFMVPGASDAEVFFCMGKTRALGLDPLKPGEVYYIKFAGKPYDLYVGYPVYVRKCSEAGLEHWDYEFDNDEAPKVCTVRFYLKGKEKPFEMKVWFDEVAATVSGGKLNSRWEKAGRFQFMKCAFVQTSRFCPGLSGIQLPYIPDEMPEPPADGFRTITQSRLDVYEGQTELAKEIVRESEEAMVGEVNAENHQVDLSEERKRYFVRLKKAGITFANDEDRRKWQGEQLGEEKASQNTWVAADYMEMGDIIHEIMLGNKAMGKAEPKATEPEEEQEDSPMTDAEVKGLVNGALKPNTDIEPPDYRIAPGGIAPEAATGETVQPQEPEEEKEDPQKQEAITEDQVQQASASYLETADRVFKTDEQRAEWERESFGRTSETFDYNDFLTARVEVYEILSRQTTQGTNPDKVVEGVSKQMEEGAEQSDKMTQEQFDRVASAAIKLPAYKNVGSINFRERVAEILDAPYQPIRGLTEVQSSDLVHAFEDEVQDFENKTGKYAPHVV